MPPKRTPPPKKSQKIARKRSSSDALNEATNSNRRKLKINPPKEPAPQAASDLGTKFVFLNPSANYKVLANSPTG